jgi:bla regulator protein BlaR1
MMHSIEVSFFFSYFVPALLNHLWQSTVFAVAVALFTLLLRRNAARVRYWLWLTASLKFLVPLQLLSAFGGWLPRFSAGASQVAAYAIFDVAGKPAEAHGFLISSLTGAMLVGIWLCGVLVVLLLWSIKGRLITQAVRRSQPLYGEREQAVLEQLDEKLAASMLILLMPSDLRMEPGVAGAWRPRLLWPAGLSMRLSDEQMRAILAHELEHIRKRDNLTATLHMMVEALFWFHPLVWWLEKKLIEERERACDEAVLQAGERPEAYAEGLLEACRFCIQPPLACVSGLGGAQLRARVLRILRGCSWRRMDWSRRLLLSGAVMIAMAMPLLFGQMSTSLVLPMPVAPPPPPPPPPPPGSLAWIRMHPQMATHVEAQGTTQMAHSRAAARLPIH